MSASRFAIRALAVAVALLVVGGCGGDDDSSAAATEPVDVVMTDHAYDVAGPVRPGGTIRVRNEGEETHMMIVGRLRDGATTDDVLEAFAAGDEAAATALVDEVGAPGNFLTPGHTLEVTAPDLRAGSYAMICFIGTEGDGTPHVFNGMAGTLVVEGDAAVQPAANAQYTVDAGQPIEGPTELAAGHHVFDITAGATDARSLEMSLWKLAADDTLESARARLNELIDAEVPAAGSGREAAQHLVGVVNAFGPSGRLLLGVDLEPGRYVLAAINTDDDAEPDGGTTEQITIVVR